jgi:hypothetical protein
MAVRLSDLQAGRALPPRNLPVLIYVTGCVNPGAMVWLQGSGALTEKRINDPIGSRTRELPACSVVPQPSMLQLIL